MKESVGSTAGNTAIYARQPWAAAAHVLCAAVCEAPCTATVQQSNLVHAACHQITHEESLVQCNFSNHHAPVNCCLGQYQRHSPQDLAGIIQVLGRQPRHVSPTSKVLKWKCTYPKQMKLQPREPGLQECVGVLGSDVWLQLRSVTTSKQSQHACVASNNSVNSLQSHAFRWNALGLRTVSGHTKNRCAAVAPIVLFN